MPTRTCAVCRVRASSDILLRLVPTGGAATPDVRGDAPGRGAWLHPRCIAEATRRPGALDRAFRGDTRIPSDLVERAREALAASVAELLGGARRLGLVDTTGEVRRSRRTSRYLREIALLRDLER